ncbi:hypothetical protein PoB_001060500 [Plakobranchus ocellatus]|uniref:Uncharacterized protein n=1 Tax=Plakobranchus ocellatus TaxID=259542 RepID=A0AAV3YNR1_9GAST|nr:hypothetical protein PoB_001060500 [Plakobranchus ocellatus]
MALYPPKRRSGGSSGRAVGYNPRGPGFDSQSGPSQIFIAPLCPPSTKWVARSLKIRRNVYCCCNDGVRVSIPQRIIQPLSSPSSDHLTADEEHLQDSSPHRRLTMVVDRM